MAPSINNIAFTSPINPPGASPILTRPQIWAMLQLKIRSAQTFVPAAIQSTTVISTTTNETSGNEVTTREVTFLQDQRKVKEIVTAYADTRVEFEQPDGSHVSNIVSEGADGLYMTYVFEWRHPGVEGEELEKLKEKQKGMSKLAVEGTIEAMRKLVRDGKY
ncbi:hypothetical protein ONS95_002561 [Cadophora gregata]|uniref:uncharacterized protein n=1 Tax=Cadophora gregata TaxID=51156 RepID=UPI0026DBBB7C|nr:uncharacterized protein ONS95_002561 [Cadophora gregata]KAK0109890.1 hypothetical protein ONS95_002561 [Cadophora gregata]KAK0110483.1 hypothetical protein ONS96_002092 [Cadophora gregata f. sp. sojae]